MNGIINSSVKDRSWLEVVGSKPATHAFILEVFVEALGQSLILMRITNKTRCIVDRSCKQRVVVVDEAVREPNTSQEARSSFARSEEHTSELQSQFHLVCRL